MKTILWIFTLAGCVMAIVLLVMSIGETPGPEDQNTAATIAIALALIPYVVTKSVQGLINEYKN